MSYDNYDHSYRRNGLHESAQLYADKGLWTPTADQKHMLGMEFTTNDGRTFRYCENGGTALAKSVLIASEAPIAELNNEVQTAYGVDAGEKLFDVLVTTSSGISDGDLVDAIMIVNDSATGSDQGDMYIIKNNKWTTSDTVLQLEIADEGGVRNAIIATSEITIIKNQYKDVIVKPTALTSPVVGATMTTVTADYFFWAQTKGPACVLVDAGDTIVIGEPVGHPGTSGTAGSVGVVANDGTDPVYGTAAAVTAGADHAIIKLNIA